MDRRIIYRRKTFMSVRKSPHNLRLMTVVLNGVRIVIGTLSFELLPSPPNGKY
jgi:hypothetical protein